MGVEAVVRGVGRLMNWNRGLPAIAFVGQRLAGNLCNDDGSGGIDCGW